MNDSSTAPILITGGTGFAGSHLVESLQAEGQDNIYVTTSSDRPGYVHQLLDSERIVKLDLTDKQATTDVLERLQPTQIYHLAALATVGGSYDKAEATIMNNLKLQLSLLESVREKTPQARILVIGSAQEYDVTGHVPSQGQSIDENWPVGPANPYGVSKLAQDYLGLSYWYSYHLDIVRVRPFNHLGERQTPEFAVPAFAQQIAAIEKGQQSQLLVGNLEAVRDFSDVKDVVKAYQVVMARGQAGEVYNIGSGQGHTMKEVLDRLIELSGLQLEATVDASRLRPSDVPYMVANPSRVQALGWTPSIPLDETLQRVLLDWRNQA